MSAINKINVDNVSYNIEDSRVDNIADSIPTASTEQKGLVQVGQGISVDANGVISVEVSGDTVSYNPTYSGDDMAIGQIIINGVAQDIVAPRVYYMDSAAGTVELGILKVGGNQYPITYTPAASGDSVQFNSLLASGTQIGTITINGVDTAIYAPAGGSGGGSTVSYQDLTSPSDARVAVGMITIDGAGYNIYVPTLTSVDWNDITGIPVDITKSLSVTPTLVSGTKIADVAWYDDEQGSVTADLYAPEQVQANWNEADSSSKAYIANKPTIPTATSQLTNDSNFVSGQNLATVATTGDYNDLTNKPTIPTVTVTQTLASGTKIGEIDVSGTTTELFAPAGGSGGDTVTVTPAVYSGTKIADIDVSGTTTSLYAPAGGSGGSTDWADITGNKPYLYQGYRSTSVQQSPTQYTPSTLPGYGTAATGDYSIAIGYDTQATNHCSLAVGGSTRSKGMWSVATGDGTIAAGDRQIAAGTYNAEDANNYFAFMVGNGDYKSGGSTTIRKNAEATAWNGNKYIEGNLYVGCTDWATVNSSSSGTGKPELVTENAGGKRVLTEDDIPSVVGDTVTITQTLTSGTKIAEIDVSGTTTDIYAPAGGATDWADITNKPDITPVAGRDGINNIAGLGGSVNQSQGVNPKGTIVIGDGARSSADNAVALGAGATVTGLNGAAIGWGAQAGRDSIALGTGSQASSYGAALGWGAVARSQYQTAIGVNNIVDANGQFGLIVGNGITGDGSILPPSDAMAIGFNGTQYLAGDLYVNCTDFTTTDVGGGELNTANCGGTKVLTTADVAVAPVLSTGTHIANITVDGTTSGIYAPTQVNANWNETDQSSAAYIQNKPAIAAGTGNYAVKAQNATSATGEGAFSLGNMTVATGMYSFSEGERNTASGRAAHAEGYATYAGGATTDSGVAAHAEGYMTAARANYSHAEGNSTIASGVASHAEGQEAEATSNCAHAEGSNTIASGIDSHAEGFQTRAVGYVQHAQGKHNVVDNNSIFADIIGNGSGILDRANAEATDWNGNKYLSGGIYVGCTDYTTTANGLTTLGAGGFRIDQADESMVIDPTEAGETNSEDLIMVDTVTKEMGYEEQEDPDTGETIQVPTTVTTTHERRWEFLPKEYTPRDLARDVGDLGTMAPENWGNFGIWQLQIWGVKRYADNGDGTYTEVCDPVYKWVRTSETTPDDDTDPTTPEEEPTE